MAKMTYRTRLYSSWPEPVRPLHICHWLTPCTSLFRKKPGRRQLSCIYGEEALGKIGKGQEDSGKGEGKGRRQPVREIPRSTTVSEAECCLASSNRSTDC